VVTTTPLQEDPMYDTQGELADRPSPDRLLTVADVADRLSVSRRTVYRLIDNDDLRTVRLRGCARIRESALSELLAGLDSTEGRT
jgi:excisionase family DNA binding protein